MSLTDNRIMSAVKHEKRCKETRRTALLDTGGFQKTRKESKTAGIKTEQNGVFRDISKSAKKPTPLKIRRYFSYYKKGRYYFVDLDLKKKGHQQV